MANVEEVKNLSDENIGRELQGLITYDEIATKLLNEKFLLTALELHAELCEADQELPILRDFFANPSNFESSNVKPEPYIPIPRTLSQATLDSLDMTRYSEDGGGWDDRVAVLEFELRKARENINSLRANLTVVTESEVTTPEKGSEKHFISEHPIKPHELRALNFLVNEYLLANSYKLTSITFSDENDNQDFEDWNEVGLNIPKPPELLQIYREFQRATGNDKPPSCSIAIQTDTEEECKSERSEEQFNKLTEEIENLKQKTILLEQEKADLQQLLTNINLTSAAAEGSSGTIQTLNSSSTTPDKFELLESPPQDISKTEEGVEEDDSGSMVVSLGETDHSEKDWTRIHMPRVDVTEGPTLELNSPSRHLLPTFKEEVLSQCLVNISSDIIASLEEPLKDGVSKNTLVDILGYSLPRIVPNVILNKREELVPLILSAVCLQTSSSERDKLLQLLFNLKKRPHEEERKMILAGLMAVAKLENELLHNEEILNLCWEQSQHKYLERRLLSAECCSVLAIYTSSSIRNSLMLSMLQQMLLDDKEPTVRVTVVKSLALLVALMDDPDKYFQCEELALTALDDAASEVINAATLVLLPILAQWALSMGRLQTHLLPRIMAKLINQLKPVMHSPNKDHMDSNRSIALINVLQYLLPHTIICTIDNEAVQEQVQDDVSSNLPPEFLTLCRSKIINPKIFYESDVDVGALLNTFLRNNWKGCTWPELNWLTDKLIPDLIDVLISVNVTQENVLNALLTYLQSLCLGFGKHITQDKVKILFVPRLEELEKQLIEITSNYKNLCLSLIPGYLMVLSTLDGTELTNSLKHFLIASAISGANINGLQLVAGKLCDQKNMQEYVLAGLWDGVMHQRSSVRCAAATIFSSVISRVSEQLVNTRVAPALVTLASDPDVAVRVATIPALGRIIIECTAREAKDKARLTLETMARESQSIPGTLAEPLVLTLASIAPHCPQNYVEDVIVTQLTGITASALQQVRNADLANALLEAYSILVYCPLSTQCVVGVLLPGLRHLDNLINQILPQQREIVHSLIREAESKQELPKAMERSPSTGSGLSLSMASVNVGQGVEDMRQRVSKIFQQKASSPSLPSLFRKK